MTDSKLFRPSIPTIEAVQWTGNIDSFQAINKLLSRYYISSKIALRGHVGSVRNLVVDGNPVEWGSWIVVHNKTVTFMNDSELHLGYVEIEQGLPRTIEELAAFVDARISK